ncbi:TatD family deoxyribonuclease [Candidatus Thorarchaeota archaeon]|nr:MAG: TatD family deoxyribonuclease [Candidatus Thorarchaeota archaeon]
MYYLEHISMQMFDAHTHIDLKHFNNDRDRVIQRARDEGLVGIVTSSISPASFRRTLGIVEKHKDFIYHSAGCSASQVTMDEADQIIILTRKYSPDIVAVGEVGLDYHWVKEPRARESQEPIFSRFIEIAIELDLPLVIHSRNAEERATEMLEKQFTGDVLMHCFDGSPEVAKRVADNGWYITLPANFSKYRNRVQAAKILPLEQILLETDGPYLSPTERRNEPANIRYGCESLGKVRGQPIEIIADTTTVNTKRFYRL